MPLFVHFRPQARLLHLPPAPRPPNCPIHAPSVQPQRARSLRRSCLSTQDTEATESSWGRWLTLHRFLVLAQLLRHPRTLVSHLGLGRLSTQLWHALRANRVTLLCKCRCIHIITHGTTPTHPHHPLIMLLHSPSHLQHTRIQRVETSGQEMAPLCLSLITITGT